MADMSRLVLSRDYMVQMLASADFYTAVPAFAYLQQSAVDAMTAAKPPGCQACQDSHWPAMRGVCDAFFDKLKTLVTSDPASIQQLKTWLGSKKRYTVKSCVLYYRFSSERDAIRRFEF